jgi:hypothetical protein
MKLTNAAETTQLAPGDDSKGQGQMDYWLDKAPRIEVAGDNVSSTTDRRVVMPRAVALKLARSLLAAVAELEDRPTATILALRTGG